MPCCGASINVALVSESLARHTGLGYCPMVEPWLWASGAASLKALKAMLPQHLRGEVRADLCWPLVPEGRLRNFW